MNTELIPVIETRNLKKHFKVAKGTLHAVDGVDLKIYRGKTLGVVGESDVESQLWVEYIEAD